MVTRARNSDRVTDEPRAASGQHISSHAGTVPTSAESGSARRDDGGQPGDGAIVASGAWVRAQKSWECLLAAAAVAVGMCTVAAPLLHGGFAVGHDLGAHVTYSYLFDAAIREGQMPVRWTEGVGPGRSQPLFSFYQPGFYYLVQLVHVIVPSLALSLKLTVIGVWWLGAAFMGLLVAPRGWAAAASAALVFALSPYLLLDVFVRAAYPELAAIAVAPGVLWAIARVCRTSSAGAVGVAAMLVAVMLVCHLPTALIFAPVFLVYACAHLVASPSRRQTFARLAVAAGLGVGMATFYWLPALAERHLIQLHALTRDYFDYRRHFVVPAQWIRYSWGFGGSVEGVNDGLSLQIGLVQWAVAGAASACAAVAILRRRHTPDDWSLLGWAGAAIFALFMMTRASAVVWAAAPALSFVQFPWRYLMIVAVAGGLLVANLVGRARTAALRGALLSTLLAALLVLSVEQRRPDRYMPQRAMNIDELGWRYTPHALTTAFVEQGYYPITARARPSRRANEGSPRWAITRGTAAVTTRRSADHVVELDVDAQSDADLVITSHMFAGWTVLVDGREQPAQLEAAHGYIQVPLTAGRHRVSATFRNTPIRRVANAVSLGALAACIALLALAARRKRAKSVTSDE